MPLTPEGEAFLAVMSGERAPTWTEHTFVCRSCQHRKFASAEAIAEARAEMGGTDKEIGESFDYCLSCLGPAVVGEQAIDLPSDIVGCERCYRSARRDATLLLVNDAGDTSYCCRDCEQDANAAGYRRDVMIVTLGADALRAQIAEDATTDDGNRCLTHDGEAWGVWYMRRQWDATLPVYVDGRRATLADFPAPAEWEA